jgi:hypothetical protein
MQKTGMLTLIPILAPVESPDDAVEKTPDDAEEAGDSGSVESSEDVGDGAYKRPEGRASVAVPYITERRTGRSEL